MPLVLNVSIARVFALDVVMQISTLLRKDIGMNAVSELLPHERSLHRSANQQRWELLSLVEMFRSQWYIVVSLVIFCVMLAGIYLIITPPSFTSTAVLITDTKQTPPSPSQITSELLIDPAVIDSQIEIVRSLDIATNVVERLKLDTDPEFIGTGPSVVKRTLALLFHEADAKSTNQIKRMVAANALVTKTKVTRTGHSYLAEISVTTSVPEKSAEIANAIADAYIQDQLDGRLLATQRMAIWMKSRVDQVKKQADAAALRVEFFRRQIGGVVSHDGVSSEQVDDLPQANSANTDVSQPATMTHDNAEIQLRVMVDEANAQRAGYEALQNRYNRVTQFMQQQSLPVTEARLLTSAEPPLSKSAPKSTVVIILASVGGLVLGVAFAFGRESLDHRVRWPSQIRQLALPFAGFLPLQRQPKLVIRNGRELQVSRFEAKLLGSPSRSSLVTLFDARRPWCAATQTFRRLKLAVDQCSHRSNGVVIGIVSTWPKEGKSTLAYNLAKLLVDTRSKVLVVDADFSNPALSRSLAPDAQQGLADLIGQAPIEQCVTATALGFDLISCSVGSTSMHSFHLLAGQNMLAALTSARNCYQYILIDLPALMTSVDSQAIASLVDSFVLITDHGRTTSDDVEQALSTSEELSNRIVATVINRSRTADRNDGRALRHGVTA